MGIFSGKKKLISSLPNAFVLLALAELFAFLVLLIPAPLLQKAGDSLRVSFDALFCVAFGGFVAVSSTKSGKKSLFIVISLLLSSIVFCAFSGIYYSMLFAVVFALLLSWIANSVNSLYATVLSLALAVILGVIFGIVYSPLYDMLKSLCTFVSGKGAVFGVINNVYSVAISHSFGDSFYYADYSLAQLVGDRVVSGVVNIFEASPQPPSSVAMYLSAKYFVSIILPIGLILSLYSRLDVELKLVLITTSLLSIATGDERLLSFFILLYNPFVYMGYLGVVFVSYFASRFVDIRIGFVDNSSIIELFKYCRSWGYFIVIAIVLAIMMYFVCELMLSKFDFDKRRILPKDVRRIVVALGGDKNIERIKNGMVYVKNPNLIDILHLDCDIHENEITLLQNDLEILQDYY